jgi:hypothetical protein
MGAGTSYGSCFFLLPSFIVPATHSALLWRQSIKSDRRWVFEPSLNSLKNDAIKEELKKINADFVQGFGIEHPVPINDANVAGRDEPQLLLAARG